MGLKQGVKVNWVAWPSEPFVKKHDGLADLHNGGMREESMDLHMIMRISWSQLNSFWSCYSSKGLLMKANLHVYQIRYLAEWTSNYDIVTKYMCLDVSNLEKKNIQDF